jgi:hypothetical protein
MQYLSAATRGCLEIESASTADGANAGQYNCKPVNDNFNQLWMLRATPRGTQLTVMHSRRCLGVLNADPNEGARFVQTDCADRDNLFFDLRQVVTNNGYGSNNAYGSNNNAYGSSGGYNTGTDPVVGEWRWFNGSSITIRPDGQITGTNNQRGRWNREAPGRYVLNWEEGWVDRVGLEGNRLSGTNQQGMPVSGERAPTTADMNNPLANSRPVETQPTIRNVNGGQRDCGTGMDDPGCNIARGRELPMDAAALSAVVNALKSNPNENIRRTMTAQMVGTKLMTARQFGQLIDLFSNENNALEAVRMVVRNVVDPANLGPLAAKFRNNNNRLAFAKLVSEAQQAGAQPTMENSSRQRIDMRRR